MADMLYGGASHLRGYRMKRNAGGTAYELVQADGTTAATLASHASLILDGYIEESNIAPASDGTFKVTLQNYDISETIIDWLNTFAKKPAVSAGTAPAAVFMEHGVERGGSEASDVPLMLWISAGPLNAAATHRLTHWGVARADLASGAIVYKNGQWIKTPITLNSVAAEFELAIPADMFVTTHWGAVGSLTVPQYEHYMRDYLVKQV